MRLGRLGIAVGVTLLLGCATAEGVDDDEGGGGGPVGGSTGTGGKVDNPGGGGSGNAASGGDAGQPGGGGTSNGGTSSGGSSSGGTSSGGTTSGGGTSSGGTGGGAACAAGKKMCGGVCIAPSPGVGCVLADNQCTACPSPPANGTSTCAGTLCDFTCNSGFTKSGNSCIGSGGGGAPAGGGGTSGSGGGTGCGAPCNPSDITSQFLCTFYCATITGKPGLCAPIVNCCACPA